MIRRALYYLVLSPVILLFGIVILLIDVLGIIISKEYGGYTQSKKYIHLIKNIRFVNHRKK